MAIRLLAWLFYAPAALAFFNCPDPVSLRSEYVKTEFDMEKFAPSNGTSKLYYELAYKDMTQPRSEHAYLYKLLLIQKKVN